MGEGDRSEKNESAIHVAKWSRASGRKQLPFHGVFDLGFRAEFEKSGQIRGDLFTSSLMNSFWLL